MDENLELLRKYEPAVRFTNGELFFPCAVEEYVRRCSLWIRNIVDHSERQLLREGDLGLDELAKYKEVPEDHVYFLNKDGHMVQCMLSKVQDIATRCAIPAKFNDNRPGREAKPELMPGTQFTQLLLINAPDPSLYLLDASHAAIYRFSMVLNFQDQMRPSGTNDTPLPRTNPTAFTITPRRIAFLAYGNQVFMAQMP